MSAADIRTAHRTRAARSAAGLAALAAAWAASTVPAAAQGCAMCRTAIDGADDPLARAISWSVIFMLSMPFAIFGAIAGWLVFTFRRARARASADGAAPGAAPPVPVTDALSEGGL